MVYELAFRFGGPDIDSVEMEHLILMVGKVNRRADAWTWEDAKEILTVLRQYQQRDVIQSLGARVFITSRYDRVKPRVKSKKDQNAGPYGITES